VQLPVAQDILHVSVTQPATILALGRLAAQTETIAQPTLIAPTQVAVPPVLPSTSVVLPLA